MAHTIPLAPPLAETDGVLPTGKVFGLSATDVVESIPSESVYILELVADSLGRILEHAREINVCGGLSLPIRRCAPISCSRAGNGLHHIVVMLMEVPHPVAIYYVNRTGIGTVELFTKARLPCRR